MEIIPGIHIIDNVRVSNCYLVIHQDTLLLIDTGMPGNAERIIDYVKNLDRNPTDIRYIVLTHADMDHIGSAMKLKEITGASLAIHDLDAPVLAGRERLRGRKGPVASVLDLFSRFTHIQTGKPDILLKNDTEIDGIKILHIPGHTPGSICVYIPGKILFTGDTVMSDSEGNPKPPTPRLLSNAYQARDSLSRIAELEYDILLPGHGAPIMGRASQKVKEMVKTLIRPSTNR